MSANEILLCQSSNFKCTVYGACVKLNKTTN